MNQITAIKRLREMIYNAPVSLTDGANNTPIPNAHAAVSLLDAKNFVEQIGREVIADAPRTSLHDAIDWLRDTISRASGDASVAINRINNLPTPPALTIRDASVIAREVDRVNRALDKFGRAMRILDETLQDRSRG